MTLVELKTELATVKKNIKQLKTSGRDTSGAIQTDSRLTLYTTDGQMLRQFKNEALAVAFSPSGDLLASGGHDKKVTLRVVESGEE
eukprot:2595298-Prymnesium_polylepis.1